MKVAICGQNYYNEKENECMISFFLYLSWTYPLKTRNFKYCDLAFILDCNQFSCYNQ